VPDLATVREVVINCTRCPRLRAYGERIAHDKRAAFRHDIYWAKPVPGFGDPHARIVLIGLAPAAHGGNRTGRMFTGDGTGGSSHFLMDALFAEGLANQPTSDRADDGLILTDVWMTAPVRCAPPDNKPTPQEIAACHPHLRDEVSALDRARVYVALGRIAFDACWRLVRERPAAPARRPVFEHGGVVNVPGGPVIVASYHPSRQNTQTGRLTSAMLRAVLRRAKAFAQDDAPSSLSRPAGTRRPVS
jgi:uracil-DNA glycosylase family 4